MRTWLKLAVIALIGSFGCASSEDNEPLIISGPLPLDPTQVVPIAPWWSDGLRLLHLEPTGVYALFEGTNQYQPPLQRGRWVKETYAAIWLEPYDTPDPQRIRVTIARLDGRLALTVPNVPTMFPLDRPPRVTEDELFGVWRGAGMELSLTRDLQYSMVPLSDPARRRQPPIAVIGRWRRRRCTCIRVPLASR